MASSVTLPEFFDEEILPYEKLNAAMDAITARFAAGIGSADLSWPLTAEGDLDMAGNDILYVNRIANILVADPNNYAKLADVIAAASSGDVVLVPPDTTVTADSGDSLPSGGLSIVGAGPSSVIKFSGSPAGGWMIQATSGTNLKFGNMTLDGNSAAGTGQAGLDMQGVTNLSVSTCWFKNFSGIALHVSAACSGVHVTDCFFNGGDAEHIKVEHSGALTLANVSSDEGGATTAAIALEAGGASQTIDATLSSVVITNFGTYGLYCTGNGVVGSSSPTSVYANGVVVDALTGLGNAVVLGISSSVLGHITWQGGRVTGAAAGAMLVNANGGVINGVEVENPTTFAIDLDTSQYVTVSDNILRNATIGVDGSGCTGLCVVHGNNFDSCTVNIVDGEYIHQYNNEAVVGVPGSNGMVNTNQKTFPYDGGFGGGGNITLQTDTIPAYTLQAGDVLCVNVVFTLTLAGDQTTDSIWVALDGQTFGGVVVGNNPGSGIAGFQTRMTVGSSSTGFSMEVRQPWTTGERAIISTRSVAGFDLTASQDLTLVTNLDNVAGVGTGTLKIYDWWIERREGQAP
jgi:hypothetical protein